MRRQLTVRVGVGLFLALSIGLLAARAQTRQSGKCVNLGYQSDRCECVPSEKGHACSCAACTGNDKCACITGARTFGGTIQGTVKLSRAKAKTKGPKSYKDVVVYLEKVAGDFPVRTQPAALDQRGLVFIPHVVAVQKGRAIEFKNSDNDKHNVYLLYEVSGETQTKDLGTWNPGQSRTHTFKEPKAVTILCKLHLEMAAYIVVLDNPFFTVAEIDPETQQATFTIKNVPPGTYKLATWHKKLKLKSGPVEVTVGVGKTAKADLTITKAKYAKAG